MKDFERLGVFYLGREYSPEEKKVLNDLVLLKSKDLTTHGVIIGMTGSGKTGLGIGLIEEAAIDNIPVIAIDPKGDLANLALTFPQLRSEDFRPWINLQEAANKGFTPDQYAEAQAEQWRQGLADWGQDASRIEMFRRAADVTVYTPGGSAGVGVSVLKSFAAPPASVRNDDDAFRDRMSITTSGLLSLIGVSGDSFTSREHILVANILEHNWSLGQNLGLPELIAAIQKPPMDKVGVMDLESFYPSKDRFALAMMFNNLLASPSFRVWLEGEALDVNHFLYNRDGKPRISVFSIAHLSDNERMFFVTMLLNEVLSWTRSQPGTGSLRALLYMDEIFGYLPPTANPSSKAPLLTLLKQARAFGLGLVLATQNPVDLDYKALSNAGTWFIGRLQTERDKERVMAGLEGASAGGKFNKARTEKILAGLGQRVFYLHSVHQDEPTIFSTRWVLSYLAGPMTREQIAALPHNRPSDQKEEQTQKVSVIGPVFESSTAVVTDKSQPVLTPQIKQVFLPLSGSHFGSLIYRPAVIGVANVLYNNAKHGVTVNKAYTLLTPVNEGPVPLNWNEAQLVDIDIRDLGTEPLDGVTFASYPGAVSNAKNYDEWKRLLNQFIRVNLSLKLFYSPTLKVVSEDGESERDFRIRLQHLAHENRDEAIEAIKKKYTSRLNTLETRQMKAMQAVEKQSTIATQKKMDAAISAGSAIFGALLGTKTFSATSVSKMGTAIKSGSRALQSGQNISAAQENLQAIQTQLEELQLELEQEIDKISDKFDMMNEKLEEVEIRALSTNITIQLVGLAWVPR